MSEMRCFHYTMHTFNSIQVNRCNRDNWRKCRHHRVDHRCRNPLEVNPLEIHTKCTAHTVHRHKYSNKKFAILSQDNKLNETTVLCRHPHFKSFPLNEKHECKSTHPNWNNGRHTLNFFFSIWNIFFIVSLAQFFFVAMGVLVALSKRSTCLMWTKLCCFT